MAVAPWHGCLRLHVSKQACQTIHTLLVGSRLGLLHGWCLQRHPLAQGAPPSFSGRPLHAHISLGTPRHALVWRPSVRQYSQSLVDRHAQGAPPSFPARPLHAHVSLGTPGHGVMWDPA